MAITTTIIIALVVIAGFILGIHLMQSPRTALWGNRLGALSMLAALGWTFIATGHGSASTALIYIVIGGVVGLALGQAVKMIHMPQTVALLNGFGGAASALVAWAAVLGFSGTEGATLFWSTAGPAMGVGALTFGGSIIAVLKLQGLAFRRPVQLPGHGHLLRITIFAALLLMVFNAIYLGQYSAALMPIIVLLGLIAGFLMTLRIGGADMPIVISLLNSLSGIAAAVAGLAVFNIILTGTGALVGIAGLILTRVMCRAMNRSLLSVLAGFTPGAHAVKTPSPEKAPAASLTGDGTKKEPAPLSSSSTESLSATEAAATDEKTRVEEADDHDKVKDDKDKGDEKVEEHVVEKAADSKSVPESAQSLKDRDPETALPEMLNNAGRIIIVPGYGMAVAQAQMAVRALVDALEQRGKEVKFAIHPVAGRMPGHMNVLLAEVGIDYEKLMDLETINPQFPHADLVIIVGACDVVNPAANAAEGTPISGMPILDAEKAAGIIVCNLDEKPGYSGVDNLLYTQDHVVTFWGDASETIPRLTGMLQ